MCDNCIIVGKDMDNINQFVLSMQNGPKKIILTNGESIHKFLGIEIKCLGPQEFEISQPFFVAAV